MNKETENMLQRLTNVLLSCGSMGGPSVARADAESLRRISMTLRRWHELECGDSNDYASWCVTRGNKSSDVGGKAVFQHDDAGKPYLERHPYDGMVSYTPTPDRERGAFKRLAAIMKRYPSLTSYVQGDPRGASLYILKPGDVPEGEQADAYYSRGVAVYK